MWGVFDRFRSERRRSRGEAEAPWEEAVRPAEGGDEFFPEPASILYSAGQNLNEHVQGNHLLRADEIAEAFAAEGLASEISRFADGIEAIIVARRVQLARAAEGAATAVPPAP